MESVQAIPTNGIPPKEIHLNEIIPECYRTAELSLYDESTMQLAFEVLRYGEPEKVELEKFICFFRKMMLKRLMREGKAELLSSGHNRETEQTVLQFSPANR